MVTTSWCGLTAFPRHGPIDAVLPRSCGFPAVQPRRDRRALPMTVRVTPSPRSGGFPLCSVFVTAKVYAEVHAVREHEAWDLTSSAIRR